MSDHVRLVRDGRTMFAIPLDEWGALKAAVNLQPPPWHWRLRPGDQIVVRQGPTSDEVASSVQVDRLARYIWACSGSPEESWVSGIDGYRAEARMILLEPDGWREVAW